MAIIPRKALPVIGCDNCGERCEEEVLTFSHSTRGKLDAALSFCSADCWQEYFQLVPMSLSEERFRKEANLIYKQVCIACKERFRKNVLKELK